MFRTVASVPIAAILSVSCSGPAIAPSESLVGAAEVPSAEALSRETLYITRGANSWGGDRLSYELRPDGSLIVTHTYLNDREHGSVQKGKETLDLSSEAAAQVRLLFWRLRPSALEGQGLEDAAVRPVGCDRWRLHDFGEVGVLFIDERGTTPIEDDQIGLFELPYPASCNTPAAIEARTVVWRALRLLPQSQVVAQYERTL